MAKRKFLGRKGRICKNEVVFWLLLFILLFVLFCFVLFCFVLFVCFILLFVCFFNQHTKIKKEEEIKGRSLLFYFLEDRENVK